MLNRNQTGMCVWSILVIAVILELVTSNAVAQESPGAAGMMQQQEVVGMPMEHPLAPIPFYQERTFLVLLGLGVGGVGVLAYRVGRWRWRRKKAPAGFSSEAVLVVDLVGSTHLATHYGEGLALRATEILYERAVTLAQACRVTFAKNTGDGCFMTFPTVLDACRTAIALLTDLVERPPDVSPAPALKLRAGISYGEIFMDAGNDRHAAAINKAFRLEGLSRDGFTQVEGENSEMNEIAECNRIFLDEEAAQELETERSANVPLRFLGFANLKGFAGLHRVYEALWSAGGPTLGEHLDDESGERGL